VLMSPRHESPGGFLNVRPRSVADFAFRDDPTWSFHFTGVTLRDYRDHIINSRVASSSSSSCFPPSPKSLMYGRERGNCCAFSACLAVGRYGEVGCKSPNSQSFFLDDGHVYRPECANPFP